MASSKQYGILLLFSVSVCCQALPSVTESYTAIGEMTSVLEEFGNITIQLLFEENYDHEGQRASFNITQSFQQLSFVEYFDSQQTFRYSEEGCKVLTPEEWITVGSPPDIRPYETDHGNIVFPLRQLINLTDSTLVNSEGNYTFYRNWTAKIYKHRVKFDFEDTTTTVNIDAYWSDGDYNVSSKNSVVPLGFIVHRETYNKTSQNTSTEKQYINIFYFAHGAVDMDVFKVREGILCDGIKQTIPFPNAENLTVFSYSTEFLDANNQLTSTVDTWWDSKNRILRMDFDPLKQPLTYSKSRYSVSDIISRTQDAVYRITDNGDKCTVSSTDTYEFDPQNIIDVRSFDAWNKPVTTFFGLEESSMIYIGDTVKRGIPCSIWQGERIDWPSIARPTVSIWEWCIANGKKKNMKFDELGFPIVNLEITVKETPNKNSNLYGLKAVHSFYRVKMQSPGFMDALAFDLFPCFLDNHMKLMFDVSYNNSLRDSLSKIVSNPDFYALWKAEINHAAGLFPTSLRVAQLRTGLYGKHLVVKFFLLGVHQGVRDEQRTKERSLIEARHFLENAINKGNLSTEWMIKGKGKLVMKAVPGSLAEGEDTTKTTTESDKTVKTTTTESDETAKSTRSSSQTDKDKVTTHTPTISSTNNKDTSHKVTSSISTKSNDTEKITTGGYSSTPTTPNPLGKESNPKRYSSAIMALVGIIMTFVGTGIGAGGTYYKIKKMR